MDAVEEVRERLAIDQVVGEVVQLKRSGNAYKGLCPFHNEKTPSFYVTPSRGIYKCFSCGEAGDIFTFVMRTQHMDFRDALHVLANKAGVTIEEAPRDGGAASIAAQIYELNAAAATYFQAMLATAAGNHARTYLEHRALTAATIDRFGLGYAPDTRDGLCTRLRGAGYGDEQIVAAGLATAPDDDGPIRDYFRGRVVFPIRDAKGRILGFGGRVMGDGQPKYLNTRATAVFEKNRVLYAVDLAVDAIRAGREAVVVEGYMDAIRAHQEGFANVVATLGTAITENHLRALVKFMPTRLVLALDADPAGQKAAARAGLLALEALRKDARRAHASGATALGGERDRDRVEVYVATLPEGQDPDDAIRDDPAVWQRSIAGAAPLMDHYFTLVEAGLDHSRPSWRQEAIDTLIPAIGQLDGLGLQQTYIERLSVLSGTDALHLRAITPGMPQIAPIMPAKRSERGGRRGGRDDGTERASAPGPGMATLPPVASGDPVRVTEEYLLGLLLLHRPLGADVHAEMVIYTPCSADLGPLWQAVAASGKLADGDEDLAERLTAAAGRQPAVSPDHLASLVRVQVARASEERARRDLRELGRVLGEVDAESARDMNVRALEAIARKEQQTTRLDREQAGRRRRPDDGALGNATA